MEITEYEKILINLENDLDVLIAGKFHPRLDDLQNIVFDEDIPELIKFARKVNKAFAEQIPEGTDDTYRGFKACFEILKREIYGK
jgi:hypothetical protein